MIQGYWEVSRRAWDYSRQAHGTDPDGQKDFRRHLRWAATAAFRQAAARAWFASLDSPELRPFVEASPRLAFRPLGSYMSLRWGWERRVKVIRDTYAFLQAQGGALREAALRPGGILLARFHLDKVGGACVRICSDPQFRKEGELGVFLEFEKYPGSISSFALSFEHLESEGWVARIGALQGRKGGAEDIIKEATKAMHGLRPKMMMVLLAQEIARALRVKGLLGVGGRLHVYGSKGFGSSKKVRFEYDELWLEAGAEALPDGWFRVPLRTPRRSGEEIKPNKRSMYAKRYAWMDELSRQIRTVLTPF